MSALRVLHATPSPASRIPLRLSAACALLLGLTGGLAAQVTVDVDQVLNDFVRADVTINVGDTVRWNWTSGVHDVLEGVDEIIDPTDAFFGPLTMVDPVFTHKFSPKFLFENPRHGHVYPYVCSPHFFEGMTGTVTGLRSRSVSKVSSSSNANTPCSDPRASAASWNSRQCAPRRRIRRATVSRAAPVRRAAWRIVTLETNRRANSRWSDGLHHL